MWRSAVVSLPGRQRLPWLMRLGAWRHAARHPWQTGLSMAGIMLGVMMVVAVDLANSSAGRAFRLSVDTVSGNITHQILGASENVDDRVFAALRRETGIRRSAPMVSGEVRIAGNTFTLLGLDLISEAALQRQRPGFSLQPYQLLGLGVAALATADGVMLSDQTAQSLGLAPGDDFNVSAPAGTATVRLAGLLPGSRAGAAESVLYADIATAQQILGRQGLDSIDLVLDDAEAERVRQWLPQGLVLADAATRNDAIEKLSAAFALNLSAMSLLALLVAALLIYNTVSLSVLERRQGFGILRSLGAEPSELVRLVLIEAMLMGVVSSLLGVGAGLGLGQFLVRLVTRTVNDLYFNLTVTAFMPDPLLLLKGFIWGTGITLVAALLPALQAGRAVPITLQQRLEDKDDRQLDTRRLLIAGLLLLMVGYGLLAVESSSLLLGFVALNLVVFGFCLAVPWGVRLVLDIWLWAAGIHMTSGLRLGIRNLRLTLGRTGIAIAALTVAVSVTVGVGVMTGSFRHTIELWLDQTLGGDIQVTRLDAERGIPDEMASGFAALPGVVSVSPYYAARVETPFGAMQVQSRPGDITQTLYIKELAPDAGALLASGNGMLLAEPAAWQYRLTTGDSLPLYTSRGTVVLQIAGIFYDYTSGGGVVAAPQTLFMDLWPGQLPSRLTLGFENNARLREARDAARVLADSSEGRYGIAANAEIRNITLAVFDRTFTITGVLRMLAIVVAFVGILSALMALQMQRLREYALLRAQGMTSWQTARMIMAQTSVMGILAGLFSLPLGLMMSDILIDVINRRSFGWSMQHILPAGVLAEAVMLATVAAVLAGLYPCLKVSQLDPALALRSE
jgi:putative ABC transport system permease protein